VSERGKGEARQKAAKRCHVRTSYVQAAKKLKLHHPELYEAVRRGEMTLTEAYRERITAPRQGGRPA